jgi:kynurenine formamidase
MMQQVSLLSSERRTHHPHDTDGVFTPKHRAVETSTGEHMEVSDYIWIDAKTGKEIHESSQWGTHFDTPYHFDKNGAQDIETESLSGSALVVDLREELSVWSDSYAITEIVIEKWIEKYQEGVKKNTSPEAWERVLLRVLSDTDATSTVPFVRFPYFVNGNTVRMFLGRIKEFSGGKATKLFCIESPSVDYVDCGHLSSAGEEGNGGAHGAFHKRQVVIGENWNFQHLNNMAQGFLHIFFDSTNPAPDAVKVQSAFFESISK